ncbi:Peptidase S1 and S6 chymotrypsin/Hap [Carbonactinospora thermoautotrophica]|uniref:Peptidase S1 and S6 chymotrypsin/Hap n=1 Tax=Carbonactinospora thermoautotrophica TaxID=1469144 RepID=A0A132MN40_9ACTN|nr:Peptidase S1 and S6 chymotrypsin/Hap [Carbonactinospora thermoautotrophica]
MAGRGRGAAGYRARRHGAGIIRSRGHRRCPPAAWRTGRVGGLRRRGVPAGRLRRTSGRDGRGHWTQRLGRRPGIVPGLGPPRGVRSCSLRVLALHVVTPRTGTCPEPVPRTPRAYPTRP